jgi:serine/threonine protein kinase
LTVTAKWSLFKGRTPRRQAEPAGHGHQTKRDLARLILPSRDTTHPGAAYRKGERIGKVYEVLGVLGVGGFSVVYLVYSHENQQAYALKTLRDTFLQDEETRSQFRQEAKLWIHLERHPYIVTANFIEELGGRLYIGMEYVAPDEDGMNSLEGHLAKRPPDLPQSLRWGVQFCHGMEYAHDRGIRCHRDVKPANIMISQERIVKITDFGFADVLDVSRHHQKLEFLGRRRKGKEDEAAGFGTPAYMPPEQFRNAQRCDERSDIYSFGVVLFQLASRGRLPFPEQASRARDQSAGAMWRDMHLMHTEAPVPTLASPLYPIIQRCMQKEPSKRYQSFRELRKDLDALMLRVTGERIAPHQTEELEAWELYNKAFSLASLGHLDEAIAYYDKVLGLEPKNTNAWNNRGACLRKQGKMREALQSYDRAIEADRHNASAWNNKGSLLMAVGKVTEAIVQFNKAIEIDGTNELAWLSRAMAEDRLGLGREAVQSFQRFLDLKPTQLGQHVAHARKRVGELTGKKK